MAGLSRVVAGLEPAGEYRLVPGLNCSIHESFGECVLGHVAVVVMAVADRSFHGAERVPAIAGVNPFAPVLLAILRVAENERGFRRRRRPAGKITRIRAVSAK